MQTNASVRFATAAAIGLAAATAQADSVEFLLQDHPRGNVAPPAYGLRFDNLFSALGGDGITSFSFNEHDDTIMTVTTDGPSITINISGTVRGGQDTGLGYGFGMGDYALNFNYTANVEQSGTGWVVNGQTTANSGSLTALGDNNGVAAGSVFDFTDKSDGTHSLLFLRDGHRLLPEDIIAFGDPWVGRGWVMADNVAGGQQDFMFIGTVVPLPHPALMAGLGISGLIAARRRRN
jgi:hypothetical protein